MNKPTMIRIPENLLNEINQFVKQFQLDRSVYFREVLKKGFSADKEDRLLRKYASGELSMLEVCKDLSLNPLGLLE